MARSAPILFAWVSLTDLKAARGDVAAGGGPIASAVADRRFAELILLSTHDEADTRAYTTWLRRHHHVDVTVRVAPEAQPTHFGDVHDVAVAALVEARARHPRATLTFHLSAGTPAMAAVWILLAKTRFPAELVETSRRHGVRTVTVPFDIAAEHVPGGPAGPADGELIAITAERPPDAPELSAIVHRSAPMRRLLDRARRVAGHDIPVLLEGESGTGKELLARAIHAGGPRAGRPFIGVNCGAIASELVESELFGHERGAFTDARAARLGHFREADAGTLFLDEIAELPLPAQVKLLRVLQEGEVLPVGASRPVAVDVRVIAATNRNLIGEVTHGRFRSDLFYRLAVAILQLPPLRDRPGDVGPLIDHALAQFHDLVGAGAATREPARPLTAAARNLLLCHRWPGNVRELFNTIHRAALWAAGPTIGVDDVRDALLPDPDSRAGEAILGRPLGEGLALPSLLAEVARHYLERAVTEARGNKTRAAELVGLASHQTLSNWLSRYSVKERGA